MTTNQFLPRFRYISGITNEQYAVITFTDTHDFVVSEIVSPRVSRPYGMIEINNLRGKVLSVGTFTVTVDIDSSNFSAFIYPAVTANAPPVCVPVGSGIVIGSPELVYTILDDAFDNIRI